MSQARRGSRRVAGLLLAGLVFGAQAPNASALVVEDHGFGDDRNAAAATPQSAQDNAGVVVLMQQMDRYRQQIQSLQNQIEKLRHELAALKSAERERYLDLDTRINALVEQVQGDPTTDAEAGDNGGSTQGPANPEADKNAYIAARSKLLERDFPAAATAFENYLKNFPHGRFRAHAHFWLGEIYTNQENPDLAKAREQFQLVVDKYPEHSKAATSLYKLASLDARSGDVASAKVELHRLIKQFPDSSEAELAQSMLKQLKN